MVELRCSGCGSNGVYRGFPMGLFTCSNPQCSANGHPFCYGCYINEGGYHVEDSGISRKVKEMIIAGSGHNHRDMKIYKSPRGRGCPICGRGKIKDVRTY